MIWLLREVETENIVSIFLADHFHFLLPLFSLISSIYETTVYLS